MYATISRLDMKRNIILLLLPLAFCACSSDDDVRLDGTPMVFQASLGSAALTRATTVDGTWTANVPVAISIGDEVKQYQAAANGKLTGSSAAETFYWLTPNDAPKTACAWYVPCAENGYTATLGATEHINMPDDQSTEAKLATADILYAPAREFSYNGNQTFPFYHQTAKLVFYIYNHVGTPVSEVIVGDNNSVVCGADYSRPATGNYGTWNTSSALPADKSNVKAYVAAAPQDADYDNVCTALIVPQQLADGSTLIQVKVGDGTLVHKVTEADLANYQPGYVYTYHVYLENNVILLATDWIYEDDSDEKIRITANVTEWIYMTSTEGTHATPTTWTLFPDDTGGNSTRPTDWSSFPGDMGGISNVPPDWNLEDLWMGTLEPLYDSDVNPFE